MTDRSNISVIRQLPPEPDALGLDPRLMTAERLLSLTAEQHVRLSVGTLPIWLECNDCGKGIVQLTSDEGAAGSFNVIGFVTAVLRHRVMRHDLSLSGRQL